jgi:hypothetical protein
VPSVLLLLLLLLLLAAGNFRARVILPDPKLPGSDKDVVVWLDASFACGSEEEAGQRGAVAALQHVAGERSLDYVLPQVCGWVCVCVCVGGGGYSGGGLLEGQRCVYDTIVAVSNPSSSSSSGGSSKALTVGTHVMKR